MTRHRFVARQAQLGQLHSFLDRALTGHGQAAFVVGDAGSGKTALVTEFASRAEEAHPALVVSIGGCNAQTGIGDPYLPFREILAQLTGDFEAKLSQGAITRENARRLRGLVRWSCNALMEFGPDLINTVVPGTALVAKAGKFVLDQAGWLDKFEQLVESKPAGPAGSALDQSHIFEQTTNVLKALSHKSPLVLVLDDLQWADGASTSLLFHLGRRIGQSRILMLGAYRPEEVKLGRGGERHPLEKVLAEFKRYFGDVWVNLDQAKKKEARQFIDALLDLEPNRLGEGFRQALVQRTGGHPLFAVELLRHMQEEGQLEEDAQGCWVEGTRLDWDALPPQVEGVIEERIGRLETELRETLTVGSVEGEEFTAEVIAHVRAVDGRGLVRILSSELDKRHHLVMSQGIRRLSAQPLSSYRFRHNLFQRYLYNSLDEVQKAYLHEDVGNALEALYGDRVAEIAVQLARHFEEAGIAEKAIHYLHQAGDRAVQLSANQEGVAHLSRGLALLMALPDSPERAEQELALQLSLGIAWMGIAPPEVEKAFVRARELCQQTGKTAQLCQILGQLSTMHYVGAEHQRARELAEEALSLAQQAEAPLLVALGHWHLGFVLFALGEYTAARAHLEQMIAFYEPQHHHPLVSLCATDAGMSALAYDACCLWCLGYPEQALQRSQEALALTRELGHPFSLADVICYGGCILNKMRRDGPALKDNAEELMRLAHQKGKPTWLGEGTCIRGAALAMLGQVQEGIAQMREGMGAMQALGVRCYRSVYLCTLAEAQARAGHAEEALTTLGEAFAFVEDTDECHWEAELYRLKGELLLAQGDDARAEASLRKAVEAARRQSAKSWELRATTSLARLWQEQGRIDEARQMLAEIYGWFTEGFDTPDLKEAQALLGELS